MTKIISLFRTFEVNIMSYELSEQQIDILEKTPTVKTVKINAGSGCAKTSTLVEVSKRTNDQILYLAYNTAMKDEAKNKFPINVDCKTTHSLAYGVTGIAIAHKFSRPTGGYVNVCGTGKEVSMHFKLKFGAVSNSFRGTIIRETVNQFEYSADSCITEDHVPKVRLLEVFKQLKTKNLTEDKIKVIIKAVKKEAAIHASELWKLRRDPKSNIQCTHDTYLKLFQLRGCKITGYDTIYLDEAQDTNECVLSIINNQDCNLVMVGDEFQSIYQWRGSVNAMEKVETEYTGILSKSYRFGKEIADIANIILCGKFVLEGFDKVNSVAGRTDVVDGSKPYTMIYRTNMALISDAFDFISDGYSVNIKVSNLRDMIAKLESTYALLKNDTRNVKHPDIQLFTCIEELSEETKANAELSRCLRIAKSDDYTKSIDILKSYKPDPKSQITLCTAHGSKGLEWDQVVLAEDFGTGMRKEGDKEVFVGLCDQERNLLYVAATRAKLKLQYNQTVVNLIDNQLK